MFRAVADGHSALTRRLFHLCSRRPQNTPYLSPNARSSKDQNFSGLFSSPGGDAGPTDHLEIVCVLVIGFKGPTISLSSFFPPSRNLLLLLLVQASDKTEQDCELSMTLQQHWLQLVLSCTRGRAGDHHSICLLATTSTNWFSQISSSS